MNGIIVSLQTLLLSYVNQDMCLTILSIQVLTGVQSEGRSCWQELLTHTQPPPPKMTKYGGGEAGENIIQ